MAPILFAGCSPEVAATDGGRILATGAAARQAAGAGAEVVELHGRAFPGLHDSHIHLGWTARQRLSLDLTGATGVGDVIERVRAHAGDMLPGVWVVGHHLDDSRWPGEERLQRGHLDAAADGRPVFVHRRDTHLAVVSSEALARAGIDTAEAAPAGGVVDVDPDGAPTGVLRENAAESVRRLIPQPSEAMLRRVLARVAADLAAMGVTSVHAIESSDSRLLESMHAAGEIPLRINAILPMAVVDELIAAGVRSGEGHDGFRIWGVKLFLDGSLGSDTAEMLDGRGVAVLPQPELVDIVERCAPAGLNLAIHAIGDAAVRRGLDALAPHAHREPAWRPRIEHAQCVHPDDVPRFAELGVIASMQPVHAVSDRHVADTRWPAVTRHAYAWRPLLDAGARLAFGSDGPVDELSPLAGIRAATTWRADAGWHPELAIDETAAIAAYTEGAAYAVGMDDRLGALRRGHWCDLTVVDGDTIVATVIAGKVVHRAG
jgi:predicted amidohydrolase YtcJ